LVFPAALESFSALLGLPRRACVFSALLGLPLPRLCLLAKRRQQAMFFVTAFVAVIGVPANNKGQSEMPNKRIQSSLSITGEVLLAGTPTTAKIYEDALQLARTRLSPCRLDSSLQDDKQRTRPKPFSAALASFDQAHAARDVLKNKKAYFCKKYI